VFRHHLGALALLAAFATPLVACAQTAPAAAPGASAAPQTQQRPHHRRNGYMRAMRNLNLSDAQKQQIAGIVKSARASAKGADPQTRRANALAMRKQIEGVLTDAQRAQLQAQLARGRRSGATPNGSATAPKTQ
jgi:Spy/CpxP family protein refolding chaperone